MLLLLRSGLSYTSLPRISSCGMKRSLVSRMASRKTLVIVESPTKARTIQKLFSDNDDLDIEYCGGHVRDFPTGSNIPRHLKDQRIIDGLNINAGILGVDINNGYKPHYAVMENKKNLINRLLEKSKSADNIIFATDDDREGEAITWHLLDVLKPSVPYKRAVFHEISKKAIKEAFENPRDLNMNLVSAQETRKVLDRVTGYTLSPLLWKYVAYGLSGGRVQSCGLNMIVEREQLRWCHKPSSFCSFRCNISPVGSDEIMNARLIELDGKPIAIGSDFDGATGLLTSRSIKRSAHVLSLDDIDKISYFLSNTKNCKFYLQNSESKISKRRPPNPFITSTLQQAANRKFGWSPQLTMSIAQSIYEEGYITYMRTDSPILSEGAKNITKQTIETVFGNQFVCKDQSSVKSPKNAQEAHEAIRPVDLDGKLRFPEETDLSGQKLKLYTLIFQHTLASLMIPATQTSITNYFSVLNSDEKNGNSMFPFHELEFKSSSSFYSELGFLRAFQLSSDNKASNENSGKIKAIVKDDCKSEMIVHKKGSIFVLSNLSSEKISSASNNIPSDVDTEDDDNYTHDRDEVSTDEDNDNSDGKEVNSSHHPSMFYASLQTKPIARYSTISFIRELENNGVGRPSTYARIFNVLKEREYIISDKSVIIPTIKGLVVTSFVKKYFPQLVEANFTASMEESLDEIASGSLNSLEFLSTFFGTSTLSSMNSSYFSRIVNILAHDQDIQSSSRRFVLPELQDLGEISFSRNGIYFTSCTEKNNQGTWKRWKLPDASTLDIRWFTRCNIQELFKGGVDVDGRVLGKQPFTNEDVIIRSGKYGVYLQIGSQNYPLPSSISAATYTLESALEFAQLPRCLGKVPDSDREIFLNVNQRGFFVYWSDDNSKKHYLSSSEDYSDPREIQFDQAWEFLKEQASQPSHDRILGQWEDSAVEIRKSRFGYFLKWKDVVCGLRKINVEDVTLDHAIQLLGESRRKLGENKSEKKGKVSVKKNPSGSNTSKSLTGYRYFVKTHAQQGLKLSDIAAKWRNLDDEAKAFYHKNLDN